MKYPVSSILRPNREKSFTTMQSTLFSRTRPNNWKENGSYRILGKAYPEQDIAVFEFSDAKAIH